MLRMRLAQRIHLHQTGMGDRPLRQSGCTLVDGQRVGVAVLTGRAVEIEPGAGGNLDNPEADRVA